MSGSLGELLLAAALFVGSHFAVSSTGLRGRLIGGLDERPYAGVYSLVALVLLAWVIWAYARAPYLALWSAPGLAWLPIVAMAPALLLLVGGISQRNPTAVMQAGPEAGPPRGVFAITRHPLMWAIGLWALSHLAANGDGASVVFFGSLAVLALGGTLAIDARKRRDWGERWPPFAAVTSNLPLAALATGRARLTGLGWWRVALALALYAALLGLHPVVLGVSALPR